MRGVKGRGGGWARSWGIEKGVFGFLCFFPFFFVLLFCVCDLRCMHFFARTCEFEVYKGNKQTHNKNYTYPLRLSPPPIMYALNETLSHQYADVCRIIYANSSSLMSPSPSRSNSSTMAVISSSVRGSPNSLATRRKARTEIFPLPSSSNNRKAFRISSSGSRAKYRSVTATIAREKGK
jgi:hypothetical protein